MIHDVSHPWKTNPVDIRFSELGKIQPEDPFAVVLIRSVSKISPCPPLELSCFTDTSSCKLKSLAPLA